MQSGLQVRASRPTRGLSLWVLVCTFLSCTGWGLSAVGSLNRASYAAAFAIAAVLAVVAWKVRAVPLVPPFRFARWRRRFRRPFAGAFLVLAALALLGGAIHAPNNYDGLAYRLPRILN